MSRFFKFGKLHVTKGNGDKLLDIVESQMTHSDVLQNRWGIKRMLLITEMTGRIEK
ncbi:hypothetical protein [Staphylococcus pseudintermedius]|uniref:hypothetical protein n=1 Tax=Staphylococcus pseudintermedius TaxID=283734 RepID=UPI004044BE5C